MVAAIDLELPALFESTDTYSIRWQNRFLLGQRMQLVALFFAAAAGATSFTVRETFLASALVSAIALSVALVAKLLIAQSHPERRWYDGRAAAESIKTLAWKYAVKADPFGDSEPNPDALFVQRVREVLGTVKGLDEPAKPDATQITQSMRDLRSHTLSERKERYLTGRIRDQKAWYSSKSAANRDSAQRWTVVVVGLEGAAIALALTRLAGFTSFDWTGIAATVSSSVLAWVQTRQHEGLARAYAVASQELASVDSIVASTSTNDDFGAVVDEAEDAISREHTLWKASRS